MRDLVLLATTVLLATCGSAEAQGQPTETKPDKLVVTGRLVDENGKPLPSVGTTTGLTETLRTEEALEAEKAVKDGRFRVELPLSKQTHEGQTVLIAAKGRQSLALYRFASATEPALELGDIALLRGTSLIGQVRDAAGKPLGGVHVTSSDMINARVGSTPRVYLTHKGVAVTDAKGMFRLRCAPKNAVQLVFWKDGYYQQELQPVSQGTPINVSMHVGGFVEGQVVDASGKGVPGMLHLTYEAGSAEVPAVHTAADGKFKANLMYPGRYRVQQYERTDQGLPRLLSPILEGPRRNLVLRPPGRDSGAASAGFLTFAAADKSGKAITDLDIAFYIGRGSSATLLLLQSPQRRMKADAHGNVHLPSGRPDKGQAVVYAKGWAPAINTFLGTGTRDKPEAIQVEMQPESVIEGRVVDESDKAIAGAKVWTVWLSGNMSVGYGQVPPNATETDKDGKFHLGNLRSGTHALQGFINGRPTPVAANIDLGVGKTKSDITIRIPRGFKITGLLKGGKTARGWQVQLQTGGHTSVGGGGSARFSGASRFDPQTITADGKFQFQGLQTGSTYTLSLMQPSPGRFRQALRFELGTIEAITADKSLEFDISKFQTGRIHGTVKVPAARGLAQRLIVVAVANVGNERLQTAFQKVRECSRAAVVDLAGRFDIRVTPGRYDIRAFDLHTCLEVFKLDETLEIAGGQELEKKLTVETTPVRLKLQPVGKKRMALVDRLRITRKDRERQRRRFYDDPRFYLQISSIHMGTPIQPGQTSLEFYARPGEYEVQVMDRSAVLRNSQSYRITPSGKQDIEVKEGQQNEFTIEVQEPPSTEELEGKADDDK